MKIQFANKSSSKTKKIIIISSISALLIAIAVILVIVFNVANNKKLKEFTAKVQEDLYNSIPFEVTEDFELPLTLKDYPKSSVNYTLSETENIVVADNVAYVSRTYDDVNCLFDINADVFYNKKKISVSVSKTVKVLKIESYSAELDYAWSLYKNKSLTEYIPADSSFPDFVNIASDQVVSVDFNSSVTKFIDGSLVDYASFEHVGSSYYFRLTGSAPLSEPIYHEVNITFSFDGRTKGYSWDFVFKL
jgi:hypothetical protein